MIMFFLCVQIKCLIVIQQRCLISIFLNGNKEIFQLILDLHYTQSFRQMIFQKNIVLKSFGEIVEIFLTKQI